MWRLSFAVCFCGTFSKSFRDFDFKIRKWKLNDLASQK